MIFPIRYRPLILTLFFLIWGYLIYCYFFEYKPHSHARRFSYKSRVDSTIQLMEDWKNLLSRESYLKIQRSNFVRDSILREFKKKPKVLIVPKEIIVEKFLPSEPEPKGYEMGPKVMSSEQTMFIGEITALRNYNDKLQHEIDSLNNLVKKLQEKRIADSTKNRPTLTPSRRFQFFKSWKKKPSGPVEGSPEFR